MMLEKVKAVIEEKLNADGVEITEETSFKEDLNADSLDLFEMVMALEEFSIQPLPMWRQEYTGTH